VILDDLLDNYPKPTLPYRQAIGLATMNGKAEEVDAARRDYYAVVMENMLAKNLSKLPLPLTKEQADRIRALLNYDPTKAG
jgi:hypothetical protein